MSAVLARYVAGQRELFVIYGRFWPGLLISIAAVLVAGLFLQDALITVCSAASFAGLNILAYMEGGIDESMEPIEFSAVFDALAYEKAELKRVSEKAAVNEAAGTFISESDYVRRAKALGAYREGNEL